MALAYLLDPSIQHQNLAGVNNVNGYFEVFYDQTDDHAIVYTDFDGTLAPEHIVIDNSGRCVMVVDSSRVYRVEMYEPNGAMVYSQYPVWAQNSGGGSGSATSIVSSDGSIAVDKTSIGSTTQFDLSIAKDSSEYLEYAHCSEARNPTSNVFYPIGDESSTLFSDNTGLVLTENGLYHVTLKMRAKKSSVQPYYGSVGISVHTDDAAPIEYQSLVDSSLGLSQEYEISGDIKVGDADTHVFVQVDSSGISGVSYEFVSMSVHRVYSGVPSIPGLNLIAGENITLTKNNGNLTIASSGSTVYKVLREAPDSTEIAQIVADANALQGRGAELALGIYNSYSGKIMWYRQTLTQPTSTTTGTVGFTCCFAEYSAGSWGHVFYTATFYADADATQNYSRFMAGFGNNVHVFDPWMNFGS